ncbi:hypothetical protein DD237_000030 [Peronospora effusa]|uniref:Dihydropteridine reductase n=1 Tax=Peronospora effusa TaxID=542832 RepID=A0A3R7XMC9_9STRA|nr:hypothetical protein DD237_000030 [Peronospora effusa]
MDRDNVIETHQYLSTLKGSENTSQFKMFQEFVHEQTGKDFVSGLKTKQLTHFGRPDWDKVFSNAKANHPGEEVRVFYCGPHALEEILDKMYRSIAMSKKLLVVGGAGALGRGVVNHFTQASWNVISVGFAKNENVENNVLLPESNVLKQADQTLQNILTRGTNRYGKINTVVCTAGGWTGGSIHDADSLANLGDMHAKNLESAFLATYLASHLLVPGGLLVLTGATAALKATPGMVSYGASKAATHHLIASAVTELPKDSSVLGVLPTTIDTPMNRKFMANADFSSWTKVWRCGWFVSFIDYMTVISHAHDKLNQTEDIAQKILEWSSASYAARPPSGHLITATTENNTTSWKDAGNPFQ